MFKLVVLSCVLAVTSATIFTGGYVASIAPLTYGAPLWQPYNYRGPLSLAPGQPANILAADGRPLDTLEVNLDKTAHFATKLFNNGIHILKKRSAPLITPLIYTAPLIQPYNYRGPLSLAPGQPANILGVDGRPLDTLDVNLDRSSHFSAKSFNGIHIVKKRSTPINTVAVTRTPLITPTYSFVAPIAASHLSPIVYTATHFTHVV